MHGGYVWNEHSVSLCVVRCHVYSLCSVSPYYAFYMYNFYEICGMHMIQISSMLYAICIWHIFVCNVCMVYGECFIYGHIHEPTV